MTRYRRLTPVFSTYFVLSRVNPQKTSWSVTHPKNALGQVYFTSEFFANRLLEKKLQLIGTSILLILLSPRPRC